MNIIWVIVGALLGGALSGKGGAVFGALLGWFGCETLNLHSRLDKQQTELTWLRRKVSEHMMAFSEEAVPEMDTRPSTAEHAAPPCQERMELNPCECSHDVCEPPDMPVGHGVSTTASHPTTMEENWEEEFLFSCETATPSGPSALESAFRNLISGDNLLVKLGVLILFFGVSFLVKYAAQHGLFPIELRLAGAVLGGCALLATGWHVRERRPVYAQVIQGGGIGILYLTSYSALHLYHLIPTGFGFCLLVSICTLSAVLAVLQDSRPLAVMGSAGGFLAPELAGIGIDNPARLFAFYALLNCGILAIVRLRAWRELNLLGFVSTFIVSGLWGARFYQPEFFFSVEPYLALFFLIYIALPVLYARQCQSALDGYIDCTLVFGTPLLAFAFQAELVRHFEYGLAWSAFAAGLIYISLADRLFRSEPERLRSLSEAFLALGTVFVTLAMPLAFEGRWTSAAWSIEGVAMVWVGLRQERRLARAFGYLLLVGSGVLFLGDVGVNSGNWPVLNSFCVGCLLISGAALLSAWLISRVKDHLSVGERLAELLLFAWGLLWWFGCGVIEISRQAPSDLGFGSLLVFVALSCLAGDYLGQRSEWRLPEWPALGLLPVMAGFALLQQVDAVRMPSLHGGWFGWPLVFAAWYQILYSDRLRRPNLQSPLHAASWWLVTLLMTAEVSLRIQRHFAGMETWAICAWGAVPALMVLLVARFGQRLPWPVKGNLDDYLRIGSAPLAVACWLWLLYANLTQAGNPTPLTYLPLLNPLDGAILMVLVTLGQWYRAIRDTRPDLAQWFAPREAAGVLSATLFVWLNAILLRTIHHWCGVPFTIHDLFASLTVQSTLSICWCLLALTIMVIATSLELRQVWMTGAGLLGVVVAKLFLVDLAGHGSLARITSFVVVGLLILLIGWFSPVPPRVTQGDES
ncbi:MAG: DUF2339 domain-containing protein [Desulfuromonadales bacterium]|nr:DUF2339 domain-containing protein [Desulfuromonadales bacterium]